MITKTAGLIHVYVILLKAVFISVNILMHELAQFIVHLQIGYRISGMHRE